MSFHRRFIFEIFLFQDFFLHFLFWFIPRHKHTGFGAEEWERGRVVPGQDVLWWWRLLWWWDGVLRYLGLLGLLLALKRDDEARVDVLGFYEWLNRLGRWLWLWCSAKEFQRQSAVPNEMALQKIKLFCEIKRNWLSDFIKCVIYRRKHSWYTKKIGPETAKISKNIDPSKLCILL